MLPFDDDGEVEDLDRTISVRRPAPEPATVIDKRSQDRRQSNIRILFVTVVVIAVLYLAKPVVVPIALAIMFAFLLTVPFTQRFAHVTKFQRYVYFVTLLCAAVSVALLIAPSAHHRILFRRHQKRQLVMLGGTLMIVGLLFLALAMTGVILLITDVLFKTATVVAVTAALGTLFAGLWYVVPLTRRLRDTPDPHP